MKKEWQIIESVKLTKSGVSTQIIVIIYDFIYFKKLIILSHLPLMYLT